MRRCRLARVRARRPHNPPSARLQTNGSLQVTAPARARANVGRVDRAPGPLDPHACAGLDLPSFAHPARLAARSSLARRRRARHHVFRKLQLLVRAPASDHRALARRRSFQPYVLLFVPFASNRRVWRLAACSPPHVPPFWPAVGAPVSPEKLKDYSEQCVSGFKPPPPRRQGTHRRPPVCACAATP